MSHPIRTSLRFITMVLIPASVVAADSSEKTQWYELQDHNAWLHNYDPTLVSRRLQSGFSYEQDDGDRSTTEFSWSVRGAIPVRDNLALGFQAGFPVKNHYDGFESTTGTGDLDLRAGLIGRLSPTLRLGTGITTKFDSASQDILGDGVFQIRPTFALRWDLAPHVNIGFNIEYTITPLNESSGDLSYLDIPIPLSVKLCDDWSASLTYKPRFDFKSSDTRHRLNLGTTRNWGSNNQFAWSIGTEIPLSDQSLEWKLSTGLSWFF